MKRFRNAGFCIGIVLMAGIGACTKKDKGVVPASIVSPTTQPTAGIAHDLAEVSLKMAATAFAAEIKADCLQLKEEINGEQVISSFVSSNGGRFQIKMDQPLVYDSEKGACSGQFTITEPARGFSHTFSVPTE